MLVTEYDKSAAIAIAALPVFSPPSHKDPVSDGDRKAPGANGAGGFESFDWWAAQDSNL